MAITGPRQQCRWRFAVAVPQQGRLGRQLLVHPFEPEAWSTAHQTITGPGPHRQRLGAAGLDHVPIHPRAHPCWLTAGVREGIAASPWLEGMPAGGS